MYFSQDVATFSSQFHPGLKGAFPLGPYMDPSRFARLSTHLVSDWLLPYIRPVVEELVPLALMEYARFALNH